MERVRAFLSRRAPTSVVYQPLDSGDAAGGPDEDRSDDDVAAKEGFSWVYYSIFLLQGVAMLWAWNMFLAAAPYFQYRFRDSPWLLEHFQSAIMSSSTITNLTVISFLTRLQANASYAGRVISSLLLTMLCFSFLTLSTVLFRGVDPTVYFAFLLLMVFLAGLAMGMIQNGIFAYVSGFARARDYTQGIMTGQAVAGVLPCVAQIVSVISVPEASQLPDVDSKADQASSTAKSAFIYFLTATVVAATSLAAFLHLYTQRRSIRQYKKLSETVDGSPQPDHDSDEDNPRQPISIWTLLVKLRWLAFAISTCFAVTMVFPVFTQAILSTHPSPTPRLLQPKTFIPLGFLFFNAGDLLGRLLTLLQPSTPTFQTLTHPRSLALLALLRILFIPLYFLCNIRGRGAAVRSDLFYLGLVQLGFGLSNGWLGSTCMMSVGRWVGPEEREVAGGFMGMMLVVGLAVGSLASFAVRL